MLVNNIVLKLVEMPLEFEISRAAKMFKSEIEKCFFQMPKPTKREHICHHGQTDHCFCWSQPGPSGAPFTTRLKTSVKSVLPSTSPRWDFSLHHNTLSILYLSHITFIVLCGLFICCFSYLTLRLSLNFSNCFSAALYGQQCQSKCCKY